MICTDCKTGSHEACQRRTDEIAANGGYGSCDCQHRTGALIQKPTEEKEEA